MGTVVLEGVTVDSKQVDVTAKQAGVGEGAVPLGRANRLWRRYLARIGEERYSVYREELRRYVAAHAEPTAPEGRLQRIEAYWIPPSLGRARGEGAAERKLLFSHRFPGAG